MPCVTEGIYQLGKWFRIGEAVGGCCSVHRGTWNSIDFLRTFHVGGVAGNISEENRLVARFDGIAEIEDLKTVKGQDSEGNDASIVISEQLSLNWLMQHKMF